MKIRKSEYATPGGLAVYAVALVVTLLALGAIRTPGDTGESEIAALAALGPFGLGDLNAAPESADDEVTRLLERTEAAAHALGEVEELYDEQVAPIKAVLQTFRDDPELTRRIAVALVREARRANLEPRVLLSVLLVENPMLRPDARSFMGAVGLMQVMPLHRGNWRPCEPDLEDIDSNICHGAQIFASYLRQTGGDLDRALLRYNGCVRGTNTPNCHSYPSWVYARAGRISLMNWLASAGSNVSGGAAAP